MPTTSTSITSRRSRYPRYPRYPRYLSFSPGELESQLQKLSELSLRPSSAGNSGNNLQSVDLSVEMPKNGALHQMQSKQISVAPNPAGTESSSSRRSRSGLLKSHSCSVRYPDGRQGCCHYTRGGPTWHLFRFDYVEDVEDEEGAECGTLLATQLPVQYETKRLENDVASIELASREKAASAFRAAIERERQEYFRRAAETAFRKKHPERFQMKALRAKALAGKYAVCQPIGKRLLPVGPAYSGLEEANREWQLLQGSKPFLVVACCNRLDRCWEIPKFNPLYAVFDPRKGTTAETSVTSTTRPHLDDDWEYLPGPDTSEDEETESDSEEGDDAL